MLGHWTCVKTWGLDDFLKASGIGKMQRMAAGAAPWPSWDFKEEGGHLVWTNHTALGELVEQIQVGGNEYQVVDGHKNRLTCKSWWEGEVLVIERSGPQGRFREERSIDALGQLHFKLINMEVRANSISWGRTFEKKRG